MTNSPPLKSRFGSTEDRDLSGNRAPRTSRAASCNRRSVSQQQRRRLPARLATTSEEVRMVVRKRRARPWRHSSGWRRDEMLIETRRRTRDEIRQGIPKVFVFAASEPCRAMTPRLRTARPGGIARPAWRTPGDRRCAMIVLPRRRGRATGVPSRWHVLVPHVHRVHNGVLAGIALRKVDSRSFLQTNTMTRSPCGRQCGEAPSLQPDLLDLLTELVASLRMRFAAGA